jgi:hypothetical protein
MPLHCAQDKPAFPNGYRSIWVGLICGDGTGFGPFSNGLDVFGARYAQRFCALDFCQQYIRGELLFSIEGGV